MHVVHIDFVPWKVVVVLFEDVPEDIVEFLPVPVLILHPHILVQVDDLRLVLLSAFWAFLLVFQSNLTRIVMNFLIHLLVWESPHQLQVLVGAYARHLIVQIHLLYFYHFVHDLNKLWCTFFYWLLQSRWIVSIETCGRFFGIKESISLEEIW